MQSEFHVNLHIYDCSKEESPLNIAFTPRLRYLFHHFAPGSIPLAPSLSYRQLLSYWDIKHKWIRFLPLCFCPYIINVTFPVSFFLLFPN